MQSDSPALNPIPNGTNGCGTTYSTDQRGQPRPADIPGVGNVDDGCDIGAYEFQPQRVYLPLVLRQ